jgi:hypothetical protein
MDLVGRQYGRLKVLRKARPRGHNVVWRCLCECGKQKDYLQHHLLTQKGGIKSCGCLKASLRQGPLITCTKCKRTLIAKSFYWNNKSRRSVCIDCQKPILLTAKKRRNLRDKMAAISHYGGTPPKCACCKEFRFEFLTIDHIFGGGSKHRREIGQSSGKFYRWLRNNKWPTGYRVLCINCNYSRGLFGYCPHEREKEER